MLDSSLQSAIDSVPAGRWAVGVSGGADSVALLSLLRTRADLQLVVAHLDHETRAGGSAADAAFVRDLCAVRHLEFVGSTFSEFDPALPRVLKNQSARWRVARIALYRQVVAAHQLQGVILAHHADDQAETIFHRLLRSSRPAGVVGMTARSNFSEMTVLRPLLGVRRSMLREYLGAIGQEWREDESNASPRYLRNRIRPLLAARPGLVEPLIELGESCRDVALWIRDAAPVLPAEFRVDLVRALPLPVARLALLLWLRGRGSQEAYPEAAEKLLEMIHDAASSPRQHFPGGVLVRRRGGVIFVDRH